MLKSKEQRTGKTPPPPLLPPDTHTQNPGDGLTTGEEQAAFLRLTHSVRLAGGPMTDVTCKLIPLAHPDGAATVHGGGGAVSGNTRRPRLGGLNRLWEEQQGLA